MMRATFTIGVKVTCRNIMWPTLRSLYHNWFSSRKKIYWQRGRYHRRNSKICLIGGGWREAGTQAWCIHVCVGLLFGALLKQKPKLKIIRQAGSWRIYFFHVLNFNEGVFSSSILLQLRWLIEFTFSQVGYCRHRPTLRYTLKDRSLTLLPKVSSAFEESVEWSEWDGVCDLYKLLGCYFWWRLFEGSIFAKS